MLNEKWDEENELSHNEIKEGFHRVSLIKKELQSKLKQAIEVKKMEVIVQLSRK